MTSGVYQIRHVDSGKSYIGSSILISMRWRKHREALRRSDHENPYLQAAWNKYGEESFDFIEIEQVGDQADLLSAEQWWLDALRPDYNICPVAGRPPNMAGRKFSPEHCARIAVGLAGIERSLETRARMSAAKRQPIRHGTNGGYNAEWRRGLPTCGPCRIAHAAPVARWRTDHRATVNARQRAKYANSKAGGEK
jgi:group I intron endonuclease